MAEIVESVKRVTEIMAAISDASQEQGAGISQVNEAVTQMDTVTQQNAALVEEIATASSILDENARGLVDVVSVFKVDGGAARPTAAVIQRPAPTARRAAATPTTLVKRARASAPVAVAAAPVPHGAGSDDWSAF